MHRDRAWRRTQRVRKIERVRKWLHDGGYYWRDHATVEEANEAFREQSLHRHSAPACCSGFCCGNQRRHVGPTLAEIRFGTYAEWCLSGEDDRFDLE